VVCIHHDKILCTSGYSPNTHINISGDKSFLTSACYRRRLNDIRAGQSRLMGRTQTRGKDLYWNGQAVSGTVSNRVKPYPEQTHSWARVQIPSSSDPTRGSCSGCRDVLNLNFCSASGYSAPVTSSSPSPSPRAPPPSSHVSVQVSPLAN
jgi:hypothetical protein